MPEIPVDCLPFDEDLSALIDSELDEGREAEVRAHVETCSHCAGRLEALGSVDRALADIPVSEVPADLSRRLAARLATTGAPVVQRRRRAPPPARRWQRAAGALAAAAVVAVAVFLGLPGEPPQRSPRLALEPELAEPRLALEPELAEPQLALEPELAEPQLAAVPELAEPLLALEPELAEPRVELAAVDPVPKRRDEAGFERLPALADRDVDDVALLLAVAELAESDDRGLVANLELLEMLVDLGPPEGV
ncbi:MAG: zf-HC2 domain-containing protein [Myxococcota bacterium]|mgnify:CR=1 FL=1|nr:zf-HC2 domain-containing protein [Myxococcota bacterium]